MKNTNIKEKLKEIFQMQRTLNEAILNEFGKNSIVEGKLQLAIIDELGELTHELKGDWYWWKKTQPPVDRQRVLEELVDVWHFVMTWEMLINKMEIDLIIRVYGFYIFQFGTGIIDRFDIPIGNIVKEYEKLPHLLDLTELLGFSFDEIYQEYLNKNKINYERLKNGY